MAVHMMWPPAYWHPDPYPAEPPAEPAPALEGDGEALLNPDAIVPPPTSRRRIPPATPPAA